MSAFAIYKYFVKENIDFYLERTTSLEKEKKLLLPKIQKLLLIEIEPISAPSRIDERVRVSKFTWAVTLVTHKGSEGNHAKIIVEGLNDGFYSNEKPRIKNENTAENGEKFTYIGSSRIFRSHLDGYLIQNILKD